jgi:diadenosine tetraphosphatase ApaH/serine/threonine PP2A family protein phosphatase
MLTDISNFNDIAKAAVIWTKKVLTEENVEFLRQLPLTISRHREQHLLRPRIAQGTGQWNYILTMGEARTNFNYFTEQVCFIGHSHQPFIIENDDGMLACPTKPEIELAAGRRYLVNVGSVGQPRDHNWRACYVIWTTRAASSRSSAATTTSRRPAGHHARRPAARTGRATRPRNVTGTMCSRSAARFSPGLGNVLFSIPEIGIAVSKCSVLR